MEIVFADKFYDAIESIWIKDRSEITYRILDIEKNEGLNNQMGISEIDISEEPFNWKVKIKDKWVSEKIGRIIRSLFGVDTFTNQQVIEFVKKYHAAVGLSDNGKIEGKFVGGSSSEKPKKATSTYTGGTTTYTGGRYSEYDDYDYGYGTGGYSKSSGSSDWSSKYGYSRHEPKKLGTKIELKPFKFDPTNVRSTFLSLTSKTYPHFSGNPHEKEVLQFLPPLQEDSKGNYFKVIGESDTMFTCHLDTADREQKKVNHYSYKDGADEIIQTDGTSILGADDKAGVAIMLYMMAHKIPGIYYFFIGEERGGIGSRAVAGDWASFQNLHHVRKCISFDRKRVHSVITSQGGRVCCSNEFGTDLAKKLSEHEGLKMSLDPGGVWTDSASFIELINECTNISVGYLNEHTGDEIQNITFLEKLAKACVKVDWSSLTVRRNVGFNSEVLKKHQPFIKEFRELSIACTNKLMGDDKSVYMRMEIDEPIAEVYNDLINISTLMAKHKIDPDIVFEDDFLKIELK